MSPRSRTVLGGSVVAATLVYLVSAGLGANLVYYLTPSELTARGADALGVPVRLSGQVEPGSVDWDARAGDLRFRVRDDSTAVVVESSGLPPDMFQDGIDVVLEGALSPSGVFRATNLMVKHSNEYGPGREGRPASERFRDLNGSGGIP